VIVAFNARPIGSIHDLHKMLMGEQIGIQSESRLFGIPKSWRWQSRRPNHLHGSCGWQASRLQI